MDEVGQAAKEISDIIGSRIKRNEDGSVTFTLEKPVVVDGETTASVTLKKIGAAEFRRLNHQRILDGDGEATYQAIAILGGLLPSIQEKIPGNDLYWLGVLAKAFFMPSRPSGGPSPQTSATS
jgi:hypothetical protein